MPNVVLQFRRGTTSNHSAFAGSLGEVTMDTTKKTLVVHDNSTLGGTPLAKEVHTHVAADVSGLKYQVVQVSGTGVTTRGNLNFSGLFTTSDDSGNDRTTVTLANNNTTGAGTYGSATQVARVTLDAQGLVTAVTQVTIAGVTPAGTASGDLSGSYPGPSVASVGGASAANVATSVTDTTNAVSTATASRIVKRDASGNFAANQITASLIGDVTGNVSGTAAVITGNLTGDVTSSGMATTIANTGVTAGTYGSATQVARVVVNAKGQVTGVTAVSISGVSPAGGAGGDLSGSFPSPNVATVGGATASNIATSVTATTNAASAATPSVIAKRDSAGGCSFVRTNEAINVVATSATPTFDLSLGSIQQMVITAPTTPAFSNLVAGQIIVVDFEHDGTTTNFAITWPANVFKGSANVGVAPSKHNNQMFWCDGTNLYAIAQMNTDV